MVFSSLAIGMSILSINANATDGFVDWVGKKWAISAEDCKGNQWSEKTAMICGSRDAYRDVLNQLCK